MTRGLSQRVAAAEAEILGIAQTVAPGAKAVSFPLADSYSCTIVVATDAEKDRINNDNGLLERMAEAAAVVGRKPDYLRAESQQTVDRRFNGDWNQVWR